MITKLTIDKIMEATDIIEVVGEFVQLKKRGANYVGLSPFANEKTPSFTVSPAKGIFKDFSSGKGGSAVTFLMELEKFTYPEALKWLAKKYGIEIEETVESAENKEAENHRESLMIVSAYAAQFFTRSMWETEEGQSVGLSYFKERGFTPETMRKFELGYSPDQWEAFSSDALNAGYQQEYLEETGLSVKRENGTLYDRYRGRVMFPIHSFTGRVIAFGGRTLKSDKNVPKYVNSPESEIYHKSNVLYGLFFAKRSIREQDNCYLVEGYADVLSVHQAGIENVVASSGTSLTVEQIRLIGRLTQNITILYDGDAAGIKAAIRGLSLLYAEEFNVKIVTFPDGHDPDSFLRNNGSSGFKNHISKNSYGIIDFYLSTIDKSEILNPLGKIKISDDLIDIISNHPNGEFRKSYVTQASQRLNIDEGRFLSETNKAATRKLSNKLNQKKSTELLVEPGVSSDTDANSNVTSEELREDQIKLLYTGVAQEKEVIRLLLVYGNRIVDWDDMANTYIGPFVISQLDDVTFEYEPCKLFVDIYRQQVEDGIIPDEQFFIHHTDKQIVNLSVDMLASRYTLSENWYEMHKILVSDETQNMRATVLGAIFHLKQQKVSVMLDNLRKELQVTESAEDQDILMARYVQLKKVEKYISDYLGSVIIK